MDFVAGQIQRFNCSASGVPTPSVAMYKDGLPLVGDHEILIDEPRRSSYFPNTTISFARFLITRRKHEVNFEMP